MDVHAAYAAIASRISSERDLCSRAARASSAASSSAVNRSATTCAGSAPRPGRPRPRRLGASMSKPDSASAAQAAEAESDALRRQLVGDVPCVLHRAGKSVELGDHECVVRADRSERLAQPRSPPVRARQSVVNVDVRIENPQSQQAVPLRGEVLIGGGDSCIANLYSVRTASVLRQARTHSPLDSYPGDVRLRDLCGALALGSVRRPRR